MPVIKANAYGHDMAVVAKILAGSQIWGFSVAYGSEALELRALGHVQPICVLSAWERPELDDLIEQGIELVAWDLPSLIKIQAAAKRQNRSARIHLKIDTGTSRIGFMPTDLPRVIKRLPSLSHINIAGVFSHLANAEEATAGRTTTQVKRFTTLENMIMSVTGGGARHLACTAAAIRYPAARRDIIRLGIGLYGLWPSAHIRQWAKKHQPTFQIKPALTWYTHVLQIKKLKPGASIGYGSTKHVRRPMTMAVLPVGYVDGYRRAWSNAATVMIHGRSAPVVGRVCMNLMMVDVTKAPCTAGDPVRLLGPGNPAETLAALDRTIAYDVVTTIAAAIPRYQIP